MATAKSSKKGKKRKRNNGSQNEPTDVVDEEVDDCKERFTFFFRSASPFSQWHPAEFEVNGVLFNCAEQFMMYQKAILFKDDEIAQKILKSDNPRDQKALGRQVKNFDETIWKEKSCEIVKEGNLAKFKQNDDLCQILLDTEGTTLVEASPFDRIWGIGLGESNPKAKNRKKWRGMNLLGETLTSVRNEIITERQPSVDMKESGVVKTRLPDDD